MELERTMHPTARLGAALLAAAVTAAACTDEAVTGPGGEDLAGSFSLSVALAGAGGAAGALAPAFDVTFSDGSNELTITRAAIVLREIELEREEDDDCEEIGGDDDCEKFEVGPLLVELPLDGDVERVIALDGARPGVYDEIEFDIHKPDDDEPEDRTFIERHPEFRRVSMRVEGTFNGSSFVFLSDLNEEQEIELSPPLVVEADAGPTNVTLRIDLEDWFRGPDGGLVDPATANDGGPNENLVRDRIRASIEGFEDEDEDGERD